MLDLEGIVARWKALAESTPVDKHPTVWAAHYGTSVEALFDRLINGPRQRSSELLGSLVASDPKSVGSAVLLLGSPWSTVAEIHETALVADIGRVLHITHFIDEGRTQRSTDWRVPYGITDRGCLTFDIATRMPSAVWRECQVLWENRGVAKGKHSFDEAFATALVLGEQLL